MEHTVKVLLRAELVEAPNVLDILVHSQTPEPDSARCHGATDQKLEETSRVPLATGAASLWFECLAEELRTRSSVDLCIAWIVRARTEALCQIGRDLQWFTPIHTNLFSMLKSVGSGVEELMTSCILVFYKSNLCILYAFTGRDAAGPKILRNL